MSSSVVILCRSQGSPSGSLPRIRLSSFGAMTAGMDTTLSELPVR